MSNVDEDSRKGTCSVCGPVEAILKTVRLGKKEWRCRNKIREIKRNWDKSEKGRAWNASHNHQRSGINRKTLLKMHGLTDADYDRMVLERDGRCDICGEKPSRRLFIDHCHSTMRIRGLLCSRCNCVLGYAKDRSEVLTRAALYLSQS